MKKTDFRQRCARAPRLIVAALGMLLAAASVAAPVCVDPERGIGGTGAPHAAIGGTGAVAGAIGGTGAPQGAIGGTGAVAGAIGGTGAPRGAIGGTGAVAGAIGGTGAPQGAIGGTGAIAGAIGGTGAPQGAIGGTGAVAGAIGGTGAVAGAIGGTGVKADGGIGGTGQMAQGIGGTGIVGTITGFASVCVNGLEVHYDENTPVTANGASSSAAGLAVGQVVAIEAQPSSRGLSARQITLLHAVAGPVTAVEPGQGIIRVMGQTVHLRADTRIVGPAGMSGIGALHPGDTVQVSGHRNDRGEVEATRVQEAGELAEHSAIGHIGRRTPGVVDVGGTRVEGVDKTLGEGTEALVRGRWADGRMIATEVRSEPTRSAIGNAERVVIEGLVHRDRTGVRVGEFALDLAGGGRIDGGAELSENQRVRVRGQLERDRRVRVEQIDRDRGKGSDGSRNGSAARGGPSDQGRGDRSGGDSSGTDDRVERSGRPDQPDRPERPERPDRPEKPEKIERPETGSGKSR